MLSGKLTGIQTKNNVGSYLIFIKYFIVYSFQETNGDENKFEVRTWFLNPYTDNKIHFVICPSHQVC